MSVETVKKRATRDGFGKALLDLGEKNTDVVVLSADLTESVRAHWFRDKFPERFVSHGVAEQDMISAAAGFALSGKVPFACSFGAFASGRAWDQVRISVAYMKLNVNIVGTHGGISVGEDGATHQALEEVALMRIVPHMTVVVPADSDEAYQATQQAAEIDGPVYLRLGREKMPILPNKPPFVIGKAAVLKEGEDLTIISSGHTLWRAIQASSCLERNKISARVVNLHTIKPIDRKTVIESAEKTGAILTVEEHTVMGGMGSAIAEVVVQNKPVPMKIMGIPDRFGVSGAPEDLFERFGLTAEHIAEEAEKLLAHKKTK